MNEIQFGEMCPMNPQSSIKTRETLENEITPLSFVIETFELNKVKSENCQTSNENENEKENKQNSTRKFDGRHTR